MPDAAFKGGVRFNSKTAVAGRTRDLLIVLRPYGHIFTTDRTAITQDICWNLVMVLCPFKHPLAMFYFFFVHGFMVKVSEQ
jgi:hypothetical protein